MQAHMVVSREQVAEVVRSGREGSEAQRCGAVGYALHALACAQRGVRSAASSAQLPSSTSNQARYMSYRDR